MKVDGTTPLWIAARILLYRRGDELFQLWGKVLETFDPEDIHDLRVASRRLREGLSLFAPCYPPRKMGRIDSRVKKITRLLGAMRNTDEAIIFFSALAKELKDGCGGELQPLLDALGRERKREGRRIEATLKRIDLGEIRDLYRRAINTISLFTPAADGQDLFAPLAGFAVVALDSRRFHVMDLLPMACRRKAFDEQHRLRIALKHFRYRMEILSFMMGNDYRRQHQAIKGYQEVLGKMHDLDVFSGMVREAGLPVETEKHLLATIIKKRGALFSDFSRMLKEAPLEGIGTYSGEVH